MIDIMVVRHPGDLQGEDIQDPLIAEIPVAIERGRNEIDANSGLSSLEVEALIRPSLARGHLIEAHDALRGRSWRGKVTSVAFTVESGENAPVPTVSFAVDKVPL